MPDGTIDSPAETMAAYVKVYTEIVARFGYGTAPNPGRLQMLGWDLDYLSPAALLSFIDQHLVRRFNDFVADNERPRIFDCGANIGLSVLNYKRQYPKARITAFEPDPALVPILRRNLARNGAADVEVVAAAAWIAEGRAPWKTDGIVGSRLDETSGEATDMVPTVDLAARLTEPVDLIKIDIEGAEFRVVPHLAPRLGLVKNCIVECHLGQARLVPFIELLGVLKAAGFLVYMNQMGAWRDLVRQPEVGSAGVEQQIIVAASRGVSRDADKEGSLLPFVGIGGIIPGGGLRSGTSQALAAALKASLRIGPEKLFQRKLRRPFAVAGEGACRTTRLARLAGLADNPDDPARSRLLLFEDGILLGPEHAQHADICRLGGGRYSHWGDTLYFSSSDGTDPRSNGRAYRVVCPIGEAP